jgi:diketogulonate reductase-like aldo/keto reductase
MADNGRMSDTSDVPTVELRGGVAMPMVGFGTSPLKGRQACKAVLTALEAGYRHIDTATMYGNEADVGSALRDSKLDRGEVFITTKLRPSDAGRERAVLRKSLRALGTDYVDLWLVHWPPPRAQLRRQVWNEVLAIQADGLARAVGVSNFSLAQLDGLNSADPPAVNQIHWNPMRYDAAVLAGHAERGVVLEAYSPLKDTDLGHPVLAEIATDHKVAPAQVVLRWQLEHEVPVLAKSAHPERIAANLDLFGFSLTAEEVARIDALAG